MPRAARERNPLAKGDALPGGGGFSHLMVRAFDVYDARRRLTGLGEETCSWR